MPLKDLLLGNFLLPSETEGKEADANCIIVTSFGRNSYSDSLLGMIGNTRAKYGNDRETFKRLSKNNFNPGIPNRQLAEWCFKKWRGHDKKIPIFGQWEIMYALYSLYPEWYQQNEGSFVVIWPKNNSHWFSAYDFVTELKRHEVLTARFGVLDFIVSPILIAHPQMLPRFRFIVNRLLYVTAAPSDVDVKMRVAWEWFDPDSVQSQTKSQRFFSVYETLARIHNRALSLTLWKIRSFIDRLSVSL